MKQYFYVFSIGSLCASILACANVTLEENNRWDKAYNSSTRERFIPVELFTGGSGTASMS